MTNLANCKRFVKMFLSKSFLLKVEVAIWCIASFLNSTSKLNSMLSFKNQHQILQTDRITSSQLASATLIKLLSYLCHVMFLPADNQQVHLINTNYRMKLQTIASSFHLVSYILVTHSQTLYFRINRGYLRAYTVSDNAPV